MPSTGAHGPRRSVDDEVTSANYRAHALSRGLSLLELIAQSADPVTLAEFNELSGMPKSTLVRLLSVLEEDEYVVRVDERPAYRLGHKVLMLAKEYVSRLDVSEAAGHYVAALAVETGQTGNLAVLDGPQALHVCVREPDRALRVAASTGYRSPLYCSGVGKVLLASLEDEDVALRVPAEPFPAPTDRTLTTLAALHKDLRATMRRGYGFDDNESEVGLRCLAVPVSVRGETLAALSVSGPAAEFGPEQQKRYLTLLGRTAAELTGDPDVVAALEYVGARLAPMSARDAVTA